MKTIKEINEDLDYLGSYMFLDTGTEVVINLFRKRLCRLTISEEKLLTRHFTFEMLIEALPFIVHSLNFLKNNTINLPLSFQQDLVLKYLINYDQIVSSTEDIFVKHNNTQEKIHLIHSI